MAKKLTLPHWDLNPGFLNKTFLPKIWILREIRSIELTVLKKSLLYQCALWNPYKPFKPFKILQFVNVVKAPFQLSNFQITLASAIFDRNTFNGNISTWIPIGFWNGILLPKLFWFTVRKTFEIWDWMPRNLKFLRSLEKFIQTVKGQNNSW